VQHAFEDRLSEMGLHLGEAIPLAREAGTYHLVCKMPRMRMFMGDYTLRVHLKEQAGGKEFEVLEGICPFEVVMYGRDRDRGSRRMS